jgi:DNA ligase-1
MLASPTKPKDLENLRYPLLCSKKIDGLRGLGNDTLVTRTLKLVPNLATQARFSGGAYKGMDGELVVGNPWDKNLMQQCTSGLMSADGEPNADWYVFDKWDLPASTPYYRRAEQAKNWIAALGDPRLIWLPHRIIRNIHELFAMEEEALNEGYEGLILRDPEGPYKQNRSTLREGYLLKVKRFEDAEAVIIGAKELETNTNEATMDERGFTKRSSHKAGKEAAGMLGALLVRDTKTGVEFEVGTGFTAVQRKNLWEGRRFLPGMIITYKHFPIGVKDKPRFPTFKSFRDKRDM